MLAAKDAHVVLALRNTTKGGKAARAIRSLAPQADVEVMVLDLADLASVRQFADTFSANHDRLDLLINNAGVMVPRFGRTADGFELQFGTNHLGHFALSGLLSGHIIRTPGARVVTVSSWGHHFGVIDFDNLNGEKGYDRMRAYAQSKLANLLFTYELQRRGR